MPFLIVIALLPDLLKHPTEQSFPLRARRCDEGRSLPNPRVAYIVHTCHAPKEPATLSTTV